MENWVITERRIDNLDLYRFLVHLFCGFGWNWISIPLIQVWLWHNIDRCFYNSHSVGLLLLRCEDTVHWNSQECIVCLYKGKIYVCMPKDFILTIVWHSFLVCELIFIVCEFIFYRLWTYFLSSTQTFFYWYIFIEWWWRNIYRGWIYIFWILWSKYWL